MLVMGPSDVSSIECLVDGVFPKLFLCFNGLTLGAGQNTPGKVLCQYLDGIPKYVSILKKKDFDNIFNN